MAGSPAVRRGVAAVAVTGGAFSLIGAAGPLVLPSLGDPALGNTAAADAAAVASLDEPPPDGSDVQLAPSLSPVAPEFDVLDDGSELAKALQITEAALAQAESERVAAEEAARVEAERAAAEAAEEERRAALGADCGLDTSGLGAVQSYVRSAAEFLGCRYDVSTMYGVAGRGGTSDHPSGKAVDFMVDSATGDRLASCALENMDAMGISYVIWQQRINYGSGWEAMEDRGGVTANHFDHVHVSFDGGGSGDLSGC